MWFVDFEPVRAKAEGRDPGLPNPLADLFPARLLDSQLGETPEGWAVRRLGEAPLQDTHSMNTCAFTESVVERAPLAWLESVG